MGFILTCFIISSSIAIYLDRNDDKLNKLRINPNYDQIQHTIIINSSLTKRDLESTQLTFFQFFILNLTVKLIKFFIYVYYYF